MRPPQSGAGGHESPRAPASFEGAAEVPPPARAGDGQPERAAGATGVFPLSNLLRSTKIAANEYIGERVE
jgi:hypothetical protein